ncbi:MAG: hypothetical protein R3E79_04250 [Caldilineaceae bacterium]
MPQVTTTTARVQVACANNIFFDISNASFTINDTTMLTATPSGTTTPSTRNTRTPLSYRLRQPQHRSQAAYCEMVILNLVPTVIGVRVHPIVTI